MKYIDTYMLSNLQVQLSPVCIKIPNELLHALQSCCACIHVILLRTNYMRLDLSQIKNVGTLL